MCFIQFFLWIKSYIFPLILLEEHKESEIVKSDQWTMFPNTSCKDLSNVIAPSSNKITYKMLRFAREKSLFKGTVYWIILQIKEALLCLGNHPAN